MESKLALRITQKALAKLRTQLTKVESNEGCKFVVEPVWMEDLETGRSHWALGFHKRDKCGIVPAEYWLTIDGIEFVFGGMPDVLARLANTTIDCNQRGFVFFEEVARR